MRRKRAILLCGVVGLMGLVLLFARWSGSRAPALVVTFRGYTNTQDGTRAVALCLSNRSRAALDRLSNYDLVFRTADRYSSTPASLPINRLLSAGASETVVVPVPAGSGEWCVRFCFRRVPGGWEKWFIRLRQMVASWGLPVGYGESMYPAESVWMNR